jgi:NADPH:quinone reductase-like Zn-dependent oxidoreductase
MKAARILSFGAPTVITDDDLPEPKPAPGQLLARVKAAEVGNWDALIRELAGIVEGIGADVSGFRLGEEVYGATNEQFSGAYAEYALPFAKMMAPKNSYA